MLVGWILQEEAVQQPWQIRIVLVDDVYISDLHEQFFGVKSATDVISFNLEDDSEHPAEGEIYISLDRAAENARRFRVTLENELYRYIAHGVYHLLGYEDGAPAKRREMKKMENQALQFLKETGLSS